MLRGCRVAILTLAIGAITGGSIAGGSASATPPTPPPTTPVSTTAAPATTVVGGVPSTGVPAVGTRGDATAGGVEKPRDDPWTTQRIATLTALAVIALSSAGYAYGRLRSAPPRHPDLVHTPDDFDGADNHHVGAAG